MKKKLYAICGLSLFLFSCQNEDAGLSVDPAQRIYLRAAVENTILMSRAPYTLQAPTDQNPLKVAVWASTEPYEFQHIDGANGSGGDVVALHTSANFSNGEEQLLNDAVYPQDENTKVYFIGLYPENGWTELNTGQTAQIAFNGCEDVMFSPQISGQYGQNAGTETWPTFKFHHLLTWLRIRVKADGIAVSEAWGNLKGLQLKSSKGNTVTIDLTKSYDPAKPDDPFNPDDCIAFSEGNYTYDLYKTGTNDKYQNQDFTIPYSGRYAEVAYVLCAPVEATDENVDQEKTYEYTLIVTTENRTVEVPIDLMKEVTDDSNPSSPPESTNFVGGTMSHQFIVNLNFLMGNSISVTAAVTDWKAGGISNGVVNPEDGKVNGTEGSAEGS